MNKRKVSISASELIDDYVITYGKYVISEMFPTYIDGLKAVIRRSLWKLRDTNNGFISSQDALGRIFKLHPHNPNSTYQSIIRLTQSFSTMNPLFELKGDEGNYSGDEYANYRYTDMKISDFAYDVFFKDIDIKVFTYVMGDDLFTFEPKYLIPKIPMTLLLYSYCIGFGFTSIIPSYSLHDICNLVYSYLEYRNHKIKKEDFENIGNKLIPIFPIHNNIIRQNPFALEGKIEMVNPYTFFIKTLPFGNDITTLKKKLLSMMRDNTIEEYKVASNKKEETNILVMIKNNKDSYHTFIKVLNSIGFIDTFNPVYNFNKDNYTINLSKFNLIDSWYNERKKMLVSQINNRIIMTKKKLYEIECYLLIIKDTDYVISTIRKNSKDMAKVILKRKFNITLNQSDIILNTPLKTLSSNSKEELLAEYSRNKKIKDDLLSSISSIENVILQNMESLSKKYKRKEYISRIPKYIGYISVDNILLIQFENSYELDNLINIYKNKFINIFHYENLNGKANYFIKYKSEFRKISRNMKYRLGYRYFQKKPNRYFIKYMNKIKIKEKLEVSISEQQEYLYKNNLILYIEGLHVKSGYLSKIEISNKIKYMKNIPVCEDIVVLYGSKKDKNKIRIQYMKLKSPKKLLGLINDIIILDIIPYEYIYHNEYYLNVPYCYNKNFKRSFAKLSDVSNHIKKEPFIEKFFFSNIKI